MVKYKTRLEACTRIFGLNFPSDSAKQGRYFNPSSLFGYATENQLTMARGKFAPKSRTETILSVSSTALSSSFADFKKVISKA